MKTLNVNTISNVWLENVRDFARSKKEKDKCIACFWTLRSEPKAEFDYLEVYNKNVSVLRGRFVKSYKDSPINLFNNYKSDLRAIGVGSNYNFKMFEDYLKETFDKSVLPEQITVIEIDVQRMYLNGVWKYTEE
ncbi:hypothetical protein HMPREF9099_00564 [Lachnospiraceae bacterium oral taxon 082 str. F0431]|nr:hypothetical protein HMPREF9099_00564 [Lachnospiraceae bacterium oral taxon 082 str. F0431]